MAWTLWLLAHFVTHQQRVCDEIDEVFGRLKRQLFSTINYNIWQPVWQHQHALCRWFWSRLHSWRFDTTALLGNVHQRVSSSLATSTLLLSQYRWRLWLQSVDWHLGTDISFNIFRWRHSAQRRAFDHQPATCTFEWNCKIQSSIFQHYTHYLALREASRLPSRSLQRWGNIQATSIRLFTFLCWRSQLHRHAIGHFNCSCTQLQVKSLHWWRRNASCHGSFDVIESNRPSHCSKTCLYLTLS